MRGPVAALTICGLVAACASSYEPIVDRGQPGFSEARYQRDLADCQGYAEQVSPASGAIAGALLGAALGAGFGALSGAWNGSAGRGAAVGASYGAAGGTAVGTGNAISDQLKIIRRCMDGRGYVVLR